MSCSRTVYSIYVIQIFKGSGKTALMRVLGALSCDQYQKFSHVQDFYTLPFDIYAKE